ncbi:MAG TPA: helix-turn-helix domain-containing protein [Noviherbaspirillum sp.]
MRSSNNATDIAFINKAVRAIMLRHGVTERQHSNKLSEILDLSYSQAHRIINGGDWTVRQLSTVAEYFGETLNSLITDREAPVSLSVEQTDEGAQDATFVLGTYQLPCRVMVGPPLFLLPRTMDYVAVESAGTWRVVEASVCPHDQQKYKVERLELTIKPPHAPAIAVIDDEKPSADNLRDYLNESGFLATSFYDTSAVERATQDNAFDGFVIDWILGDRTAEPLIRHIRTSTNPSAPIILLTGEYDSGRVNVSEVARVVRQFDVVYQEKPTRSPVIAAELAKALGC